mmetsp:Transcript_26617/g.66940  ORF Transcript_26617/g.66940 Transcript_26617/m.66940 type:complete len:203 (+) Transcript_26617:655-1263(+)
MRGGRAGWGARRRQLRRRSRRRLADAQVDGRGTAPFVHAAADCRGLVVLPDGVVERVRRAPGGDRLARCGLQSLRARREQGGFGARHHPHRLRQAGDHDVQLVDERDNRFAQLRHAVLRREPLGGRHARQLPHHHRYAAGLQEAGDAPALRLGDFLQTPDARFLRRRLLGVLCVHHVLDLHLPPEVGPRRLKLRLQAGDQVL